MDAGAVAAKENPVEIEGADEETTGVLEVDVVPNAKLADPPGAVELKLNPVDGADEVATGVENKLLPAGAPLVCVPKLEPNNPPVGAAEETDGEATLPKPNPVEGVWALKAGAAVV